MRLRVLPVAFSATEVFAVTMLRGDGLERGSEGCVAAAELQSTVGDGGDCGSAYVSIRQHTPAYACIRQHTSAYVSIRQHTSAYVSMRLYALESAVRDGGDCGCAASALVLLY